MASRGDLVRFLVNIRNLLSIYFALNLLTIIFISSGLLLLPNSFLGMDNRWIYFFLPWVIITFAVDALRGQTSRKSWIIFLIATVQLFAVWSVGAMMSMIIWIVLWIIESTKIKYQSRKSLTNPLIFFILITITEVLLISGLLIDITSSFIVNYFHKDPTLSGRTLIWDVALQTINASPIFGEGVQSEQYDIYLFTQIDPENPAFWVNHPHNYFLNVTFHGGWIAGALFVIIILMAFNSVKKAQGSLFSCCMLCGLVCFAAASLVDTLDFSMFYLLIALSCNSSYITKKYEDNWRMLRSL
ncbi:O-antigen ligase [Adlercreutzia sp. ZJ154]|uniref:O-antigen ligase family protein n=1 Tax=Adlercreutzia sp. ZJ154 TaxID=2709790 RepID=UPI0013EB5717|nr:O-antigen ligase family protein [Adlercreutzia sp. ZJ154]